MATQKFPCGTAVTTFPALRPGTDLLNAPRSVLKSLGLWPALAHSVTRRRWSRLLGKGTHFIEPKFEWSERSHRRRQRPSVLAADDPDGWSGALVYAPASQKFQSVSGQWTVPTTQPSTTGGPTYSAFWIGIDGDANPGGSQDVCQVGVECDTGNTGDLPLYPWYEWFPGMQVKIPNFPVSPGDLITCLMTIVDPTQGNPLQCSVLIQKKSLTTGDVSLPAFLIHAPKTAAFMGNCAEWIAERPLLNDNLTQLANYGDVTFTGCSASTANQQSVQPGPHDTICMTDGASIISKATANSGTVDCKYTGP